MWKGIVTCLKKLLFTIEGGENYAKPKWPISPPASAEKAEKEKKKTAFRAVFLILPVSEKCRLWKFYFWNKFLWLQIHINMNWLVNVNNLFGIQFRVAVGTKICSIRHFLEPVVITDFTAISLVKTNNSHTFL